MISTDLRRKGKELYVKWRCEIVREFLVDVWKCDTWQPLRIYLTTSTSAFLAPWRPLKKYRQSGPWAYSVRTSVYTGGNIASDGSAYCELMEKLVVTSWEAHNWWSTLKDGPHIVELRETARRDLVGRRSIYSITDTSEKDSSHTDRYRIPMDMDIQPSLGIF